MALRLLITGATGQLGAYLLREAGDQPGLTAWGGPRGGDCRGVACRAVDLTDADAVRAAFREARPDVILHAAAWARVADCHRNPEAARRVNVGGTATLAELAGQASARLLLLSTDLVFDGTKAPYREDDPPGPVSVYGRTKLDAEAALQHLPRCVVARVSLLYGPSLTGRASFFDEQLRALRAGRPATLFADEWRTPLDLATAAHALVELARSDVQGIVHIGGPERLSRLEMGQRLARCLGVTCSGIVAVRRDEVPASEPRPRDVSLDSSRWRGLFPHLPWPTWEEALAHMGV